MRSRGLGWTAAATLLAVLGLDTIARAQPDDADDALKRPERLTVGLNDQFLGQLTPDEKTLYFVSNRDTRKQIYAQDMQSGHVHAAFDEGSDVTWPRVSPDGKALLYVSFRDRALGQLCIRELPSAEQRRCFDDAAAALQAEWIDATRILLVARTSIGGDLRLSEVSAAGRLVASPLLPRNWTSPAASPDGRWLVGVPLDRVAKPVGPGFAGRAARQLEVVRLDGKAQPVPLALELPGLSGQPVFSRDGRFLYFAQFFSDSNHDGTIDARDHGVLFRVPFVSDAPDAPARAAAATPVQLTDAGLNCQYPAPAGGALVATCSRGDQLAVYSLPQSGEVPSDWTADKLRSEIELGVSSAESLLLYRHALAREQDRTLERLTTIKLVMLHLELEEFDAAEFYVKKLSELKDPATRGVAEPLRALIATRRTRSDDERGRTLGAATTDAEARLAWLEDGPNDSPAARVLNHVVKSEILDALGDLTGARQAFESAPLGPETPRSIVEIHYSRADALYRELDDRDALVALGRRLATMSSLAPEVQLDYARAATRALVRGRPFDEAAASLAHERAAAPDDSELGFACALSELTLAIRSEHLGQDLKNQIVSLYQAQRRPDRRRAVMLDALGRAADVGADSLIEALATHYVDDVAAGTDERRRAERLYRRAIVGRAFRRLAKGHLAEARRDFDDVFVRTGALDAAVGAVDLRLREGQAPATVQAELARGAGATPAAKDFVQAYLIAHSLPRLSGEAHAAALVEARDRLRASWPILKNKGAARALMGAISHEDYVRTGSLDAAEKADSQYLVALDLMQHDPRAKALILRELGLLHGEVGNFRIALDYLDQREKLPYADAFEAFAIRLARARALLHVDREADSATAADAAFAMVEQKPELEPYRVLALDRAALANLAAGRFARALVLYDAELPLLVAGDSVAARRNRFVVRLARAAGAVGDARPAMALDDLAALEPTLDDPAVVSALASAHVGPDQAARSYRLIAAGLRANANVALGRLAPAAAALERQREIFADRFAQSDRDEDLRALILVETRLAQNAAARRDLQAAGVWVGRALDHADSLVARTKAELDVDQLRVLWLGAELKAIEHASLPFDVVKRLEQAHDKLVNLHDPTFRTYARWFEIYLTLQGPTAGVRADSAKLP